MQGKLFIATTNAGKLRDFRAAADMMQILLEPLPGIAKLAAPVEDADTFDGNARLKAVAYSQHLPGAWVLADDSGLEVDALSGAPGVYSARYAARSGFLRFASASGDAASVDELNNACLLHHMMSVDKAERTARFKCVLAAARDGVMLATGEGTVEGVLLRQPRGTGGFGYDPLFLLPALDLTMAELSLETKLGLSHRGRALKALLSVLRQDQAD